VSENPLEVFWGQLHEEVWIVSAEKFLETAKQAMGARCSNRNLPTARRWRMNFARTPKHTKRIRAKIRRNNQTPPAAQRPQPIDYAIGSEVSAKSGRDRLWNKSDAATPARVQQTALGQTVNGDFGDTK